MAYKYDKYDKYGRAGGRYYGRSQTRCLNDRFCSSVFAVPDGSPVTQVACGGHFSHIITAEGVLFGCGRNNVGQLGVSK